MNRSGILLLCLVTALSGCDSRREAALEKRVADLEKKQTETGDLILELTTNILASSRASKETAREVLLQLQSMRTFQAEAVATNVDRRAFR